MCWLCALTPPCSRPRELAQSSKWLHGMPVNLGAHRPPWCPLQSKHSTATVVLVPGSPHAVLSHSVVSNPVTPCTVACQTPLSMEFFQEKILEWGAVSYSGDLPDSRIELTSLVCPALAGGSFTTNATWKVLCYGNLYFLIEMSLKDKEF